MADTKSKYIPDPNNPTASIINPNYVAPTKTSSTLKDYYAGLGQSLPTIEERGKTFESLGLGTAKDYKGDLNQNVTLLSKLQGGTGVTPEERTLGSLGIEEKKIDNTGANVGTGEKTVEENRASLLSGLREKAGLTDLEKQVSEGMTNLPSKESIYAEKSAGIEESKANLKSLDERLTTMRQAIDESEKDIRARTIASGGIVTESQTQRLLASEKEPLVTAYNRLIESRNNLSQSIKDAETSAESATERTYADKTASQTALQNKYTFLAGLTDKQYEIAEKDLADKLAAAKQQAEDAKGKVVGSPIIDDYGNVSILVQNSDGSFTTKSMGAIAATKTKAPGTSAATATTGQILDKNGEPISLNAAQVTTLTGFNDTIDGVENSLNILSTGVKTGPMAAINLTIGKATGAGLGDTTKGGMADQLKLEQQLSQIKAAFMKAISGAAVSDQEVKRLSAFLPSVSDQEDVIKSKLNSLKTEMEKNKANFVNALGGVSGGESASKIPSTEKRVTVIAPDGSIGTIPESQLSEALASGYKQQP
jgi:hypothetical protein